MPAFVSNGWAAKDYTHINYAGGRRIARALAESITHRVYHKLQAKEEAARIEAERIRLEVLAREATSEHDDQPIDIDTIDMANQPIAEGVNESTNIETEEK